jgi:hypothetical protein
MRYKRQILLFFMYFLVMVFAYYGGPHFHLDKEIRTSFAQVYYITSLFLSFFIFFSIGSNLVGIYFDGLKKKLSSQYPQIDPTEFDFYKFDEKHNKKIFLLIQPITCIIAFTPYLFYFILHQYDLKIMFGILANPSMALLILQIIIHTFINQFLFMRHLDQLLQNPK